MIGPGEAFLICGPTIRMMIPASTQPIRPPTVDEWDKYELHHRARMAMKPGITGMWQVSGRSDITDFEQIVKLDTQYICNWNIGLDLKILCQTVSAVLKHKGAM